uniref:NADH dehydrogenase subunit 6 n=1 Tax=Parastrongyloides trichosuri TaxID=131310 RepID=A0A0S3M441_PARTI|nr:NADH dehydrogenase subunit 6 [Parastrongyloides trichosuri]BAT21175.1 NADH dehydrogenase subunit 6 [Parastrongyloides trichosuri]
MNVYMFLFFSIFFCYCSFLMMDPMKSSFFLVFSLLVCMPMVSFFTFVWYSYFICLLFLSGVFVIVVYFSSLSSFYYFNYSFSFFVFLISFFVFSPIFVVVGSSLGINIFYYDVYFLFFILIVCCLLFFMNFVSVFLCYGGALRKI